MLDFAAAGLDSLLDFIASITSSVLSWPVAFLIAVVLFRKPVTGLIGRVKRASMFGNDITFTEGAEVLKEQVEEVIASELPTPQRHRVERLPQPTETPAQETGDDPPDAAPTPGAEESSPPAEQAAPGDTAPGPDRGVGRGESGDSIAEPVTPTSPPDLRPLPPVVEPPPAVNLYDADPTGVVVRSWKNVEDAIRRLARDYAIGGVYGSSTQLIQLLQKKGVISLAFADSLDSARRLRNAAAHGAETPTSTGAMIYADTAQQLASRLEGMHWVARRVDTTAPEDPPTG